MADVRDALALATSLERTVAGLLQYRIVLRRDEVTISAEALYIEHGCLVFHHDGLVCLTIAAGEWRSAMLLPTKSV